MVRQLRVIFDTNIYTFLVKDKDIERIKNSIKGDKAFIVYGIDVIKKELQKISKKVKVMKKLRSDLLGLYRLMIADHELKTTKEVLNLVNKYFTQYKKIGGGIGFKRILNDFKIVACATIKNLDIIFSEDRSSMMNVYAKRAYEDVNFKEKLRTPTFYRYKTLRNYVLSKI